MLSCCSLVNASWFFFFSSRRRHTRSKRDWSSDVCSSDLGRIRPRTKGRSCVAGFGHQDEHSQALRPGTRQPRSEERRVGKECRARGATATEKEKEEQRRERRGRQRGGEKDPREYRQGQTR